ncbi:MAG TPA: hypothetical protein DHW22_00340 [Planctomycetaceae bacterium]|nr:hypothetical protein [Planctomycetaceae bacterium]
MPHRCANGKERRVPLAADRSAALAMLNELVRKAEREAAGLADPFEAHRKRSLVDHLAEYKKHLESKGTTKDHVQTTHQRALAIVDPTNQHHRRPIAQQRTRRPGRHAEGRD